MHFPSGDPQVSLQAFTLLKGSQAGVVVIIHASHLYDPGSNPCLRMWAEICQFQSDFEGFLRILRFSSLSQQ